MRAGSNIDFFDDDGRRRLIGREGNRIASALGSNRLAVDGRGAILADYAVRAFVESHAATNFAGVKYGSDFSVGILIKPETYLRPVFSRRKTMEISIRNLRHRNTRLSIRKRHRSSWRKRAYALRINELSGDQHNEQKRACVNRGHPQSLPPHAPKRFAPLRACRGNRRRLAALHHEQEQAEPSILAREYSDLAFDLALEPAPRLHHENDHGYDEKCRCQHNPAFENVLVPVAPGKQNRDSDAANKSGNQSGIHRLA